MESAVAPVALDYSFQPAEQDLGVQHVGKKVEVVFNRPAGGKNIRDVSVSCGCTEAQFTKPQDTQIRLIFRPNPVPEARKLDGFYFSTKYATVYYADGSMENLKFTATVYE